MKRRFLLPAAVLVIGLVALVLFAIRPAAPPPTPQQTPPQAAVAPPAATPATSAASPAAKPDEKPGPFAFRRLAIDTAKETPEACLVFSERLREAAAESYRDHLRLAPETPVALRVAADQLCRGGLAFGRKYRAELLEGLPAASAARLAAAETLPLELADQPPLVAFRDGLILARDTAG